MATKDLGRTPLEAGNTTAYHEIRREERRRCRHEAKMFCRKAVRDLATYEETPMPLAPCRSGGLWSSDLHDHKMGPVRRWIRSQVGRQWNDVYGEIRDRFAMRTFAGWHIFDFHLLFWYVDVRGDREFCDLYVDDDGTLRERDNGYRKYCYRLEQKTVSDQKLTRWLSGRKVGQRRAGLYTALYWFTATGHIRREEREVFRKRADHWGWETVRLPVQIMTYRQGRPLSQKEIAFYERLTSTQRGKASEDLVLGRVVKTVPTERPPFRMSFQPTPGAPPLAVDKAA